MLPCQLGPYARDLSFALIPDMCLGEIRDLDRLRLGIYQKFEVLDSILRIATVGIRVGGHILVNLGVANIQIFLVLEHGGGLH